MVQQVIPNKKYPELITKEVLNSLRIHTGTGDNIGKDIQGLYRPGTGEIFLSTTEKTVPRVLWHEQMHKLLNETLGLEEHIKTTIQWDNIANSLEEFLFPAQKPDIDFINYPELVKLKGTNPKIEDILKKSFR
jgi:hypothetical protein